MLDAWFAEAGRTLQSQQMPVLTKACTTCPVPLYARVAFKESCKWKSYTPKPNLKLENTITALINTLLDRVETYHGKTVVSRALSYITAAKEGLRYATQWLIYDTGIIIVTWGI